MNNYHDDVIAGFHVHAQQGVKQLYWGSLTTMDILVGQG